MTALDKHPIAVKSATSFFGFMIGDLLAQNLTGHGAYDVFRTLRLVSRAAIRAIISPGSTVSKQGNSSGRSTAMGGEPYLPETAPLQPILMPRRSSSCFCTWAGCSSALQHVLRWSGPERSTHFLQVAFGVPYRACVTHAAGQQHVPQGPQGAHQQILSPSN